MLKPFQQQAALVIFQLAVGPLPIQPLADGARDFGHAQSGAIASCLPHQCQVFGREVPPAIEDGMGIDHRIG